VSIGIKRVVLLRYKPPGNIEQWKTGNPTAHQMNQLHIKINYLLRQIPRLTIRVDCSMSFVQRHLPVSLAAKLVIKGCAAADRILAIARMALYIPVLNWFIHAVTRGTCWIMNPRYCGINPGICVTTVYFVQKNHLSTVNVGYAV
jgi:hypothetical protein